MKSVQDCQSNIIFVQSDVLKAIFKHTIG